VTQSIRLTKNLARISTALTKVLEELELDLSPGIEGRRTPDRPRVGHRSADDGRGRLDGADRRQDGVAGSRRGTGVPHPAAIGRICTGEAEESELTAGSAAVKGRDIA
jgi:hypothetical protein